ncbi:Pr6Pr family membrane protein [Catelliglobosispora koreensis]|uniref:Pr6Pr family membrane protein n=1 Tax=Catelliglobosispora koreensis TaxID=129052 RepID=UPI000686CE49|nr:Pr6Pr family membrane protein [Catelliglobosispora koreensis]
MVARGDIKGRFGTWYRVVLGILVLLALAKLFYDGTQRPTFSAVNFFSYFTNLSNILGALLFIYCGLRGDIDSLVVDLLRGAATVYLATTGIVYNLLLTGEAVGVLNPYANVMVHAIMPLAAVGDWLMFPPKNQIQIKQALLWLIFPFLYLTYSLIRGPITGFYPYPFLNPETSGGYGAVAVVCIGIAIALVLLVLAVVWTGNRQRNVRARS